jgi:hypothetical protein
MQSDAGISQQLSGVNVNIALGVPLASVCVHTYIDVYIFLGVCIECTVHVYTARSSRLQTLKTHSIVLNCNVQERTTA